MQYVKVIPTNKSYRPHLPTEFGKAVTWGEDENIFPLSPEVTRLEGSRQITTQPASDAEVQEYLKRHGALEVPAEKKRGKAKGEKGLEDDPKAGTADGADTDAAKGDDAEAKS